MNGLRRVAAWVWHKLVWIVLAVLLAVAACVLALRYWVLPNIENYRETIAQSVSKAVGQKVTIGGIVASWDGLHPQLKLQSVVLHDKSGREALTLQRVDSTLSWLSVPTGSARFHSLDFYEPALDIRRDKRGVISVAGIEMSGDSREGGFSEWLLAQRDIEIHNAAVAWTDEMRGTPTLTLQQVRMHLINRGHHHRFGLKAIPPAQLASPVDLRGDFDGASLKDLAQWNGRVFVQLDYADIAAWRTWIPFHFEFPRGAGAVRAWAGVKGLSLHELTADVRLSNVRTRFAKDLPELDLSNLSGRVGWKKTQKSVEFSTQQLALTTSGNLELQPMDFTLKATLDATGQPAAGEIKANAIDIAPLVSLADHLPIDQETRKRLAELSPQGRLFDVQAKWEGALPDPAKYSARGRFEDLAMNRYGVLPGLRSVSGMLDATEKGGSSQLTAREMKLDLPDLFKEPLQFDTLTAHAGWTRDLKDKGFELKLSNVSYHNADLAGTLSGSYRTVPDQPGIIDLTGNLMRADARSVMRYLPITVARGARPWMENAFLAGTSGDVSFRVKGDLREFPFADNKGGTFFVTAKISGGTLHYGEGWPNIENIDGDFAFRGKRMDIVARHGTIYGVRLSKVHAEMPDLSQPAGRVLTITGEAEGGTPDFLKFIATSPVSGYIEHFTDGMQGEGAGKLDLKLVLPLVELDKTRLNGTYQMTNNRLVIEPSLPPLEQVTGKLEFTEAGVNVPAANAMFFGGPLAISGSTQRDGSIRIGLQGRVAPDTVRRAGGPAWLTYIRGATDWRGTVNVRKKTVDVVLESNLQGIASNLPAPFVKTAAEPMPVRIERRFVSADRDVVALTVGDIVSARLSRHSEGKRTIIDRGVVRLGGGAAGEPERDGVWISGSLKSANLDGWLKIAGGDSGSGGSSGSDISYTLAALDVKFGELEVYDRKFSDIAITSVKPDAATTRFTLSGKEFEGTADWSPAGKGRLVARMKKFIIPAATTVAAVAPAAEKPVASESPQLPALDIVAEHFQMGSKVLGKLELKATPQDRDWRIEQLKLSNPDGILEVDGVWQSWLANPRTNVNVRWNITDVGKTLTRLGYPEGVRRGMAVIGGSLAWNGGPQQLDYPTLSGNFVLQAVKGQFLKMDPGIGKLLGVLSLQSLPRRLSLDFRDVFGDGFAFDEVLGAVKIDRGVVTTENFRINGPSARVAMSGSADINKETQNLQVKVNPHVSDGASIVGALVGGPIAGLAAFIAQKIFKDPLDDLVAFHYNVTGSWVDPVVTRVSAPARPESARNPE
ncbi:MAG: YhdP family protein [Burkholderiales bacterium]